MSFAESEAQDGRRMVENGERTKALLGHTERHKAELQLGLEIMGLWRQHSPHQWMCK